MSNIIDKLQEQYGIHDESGLILLGILRDNYDLITSLRSSIKKEPMTVNRYGQMIPNPGIDVCNKARNQIISALRQLGLKIDRDKETNNELAKIMAIK